MGAFEICYKAKQNWEAAEILKGRSLYNAAVNRLYYALFQVPYQKLVEDGKIDVNMHGKKHQKVIDYLNEVEGKDIARCFRSVHDLRGVADYEARNIDSASYERILEKAQRLRLHFRKF